MICKLCLRERELCNSHIIPAFLYKPGYDENGQILVLEKGANRAKNLQHQKDAYEKLLCSECDGKILNLRYETPFQKLWYLEKALPESISEDYIEISKIDYASFKLFHLSILWRASISSLPPYKAVSLEKQQEERIRNMLLNNDPGLPNEYQIFATILLRPRTNKVLDGFIMSPIITEFKKIPVYMFVFGGCVWHYVIGDQIIEEVMPITLSTSGSIGLKAYDATRVTPINRFFLEEASQMSLPKKRKRYL